MGWQFASLSPSSLLGNLVQLLEWIQNDILTWGSNVDAANNGLTNSQFVVLNPGALVGAQYTVTSASWASTSGGQITYGFSAGTWEIQPNQYVTISGASPTGYNLVMAPVVSSTTTSIVVTAPSNPGTWTSGGTILVGGMNPAAGMIQSDPNGNLWGNSNGTFGGWVQQTTTSPNVSAATGTLAVAHGGTGTASTLTGLVRGNSSAMTAAELSGDVTTSGSNAATVVNVNGGSIPASAGLVGTNSSKQLVSASLSGDVTTSGTAATVVKVNGASLPVSAAQLATNSSGQIILGSGGGGFSGFPVNPETATYQVLAADFSNYKTIVVASGTFTITLVASGTQPANGQCITIINYGSGTVTVVCSGQNINGGTSSLTLPTGTATAPISCEVVSDGTNYFASISGVQAGGSGVTSVGLSLPSIFSVSGSPVTTAGTLTATLATETANTVFSGPSSGSAAAPTFRALVTADLPAGGITVIVKILGLASKSSNQSGTLYAVPSGQGGFYRVSIAQALNQTATSTCTTPTNALSYTNADNNGSITLSSVTTGSSSNTAQNVQAASVTFYAEASTNITYSQTGYASSGATAMTFTLNFVVEYLGFVA